MSFLPTVKVWIWVSVLASLAGWTLSAMRQLTIAGYLVFGVAAAVILFASRDKLDLQFCAGQRRGIKLLRRFCRGFPLMFAAFALLVFLGGVIYPPTNHTGLSYRIPRVLQWLDADGWFWIHTPNYRMNNRACGIEWLSAPLLLFTKSDRGLFLLNFIPFLLMPGLLFSALTRLGVRARAAWPWMWLLPTGYVFLLQAGSAGNDAFPAVYALAAVDFAARAWASRRASDLWYSLLAVALLNGAKASNLPLTLPWLVLVLPLLPLLKKNLLVTSAIVLVAAAVSFLPTAILNIVHLGDWSGLNIERAGMSMKNPFVGVWGNGLLLFVNNLCPPVFPMAGWWNQHSLDLLPSFLSHAMNANFEQSFQLLWELPTEDWTGIGAGVSLLIIVSVLWKLRTRLAQASGNFPSPVTGHQSLAFRLALVSPWIALLAYCMKSGMVTPARLIAPYYPLLLPLLLVGAEQSELVRRRWWRSLAWLVFVMAFFVLIVTPARPLWPAQTILGKALEAKPGNRLLERGLKTYSVYSVRADPLAKIREQLPPDLKIVGFLGTEDDLDISLWKPYGSRHVEPIMLSDSQEFIRAHKVQYAVISEFQLQLNNASFEEWQARNRAEVLASETITVRVSTGPQKWFIVRFKE